MNKYLEIINCYEHDKKIVKNMYNLIGCIGALLFSIVLLVCFSLNNVFISMIFLVLCFLFYGFYETEKSQTFIFNLIKKIKKNQIITEDISTIFKYDDYRILSDWNVDKISANSNPSYVTLQDEYIPIKYEYFLNLGINLKINISEEQYEKLRNAKKENAYFILKESEYQQVLNNEQIKDYVIV